MCVVRNGRGSLFARCQTNLSSRSLSNQNLDNLGLCRKQPSYLLHPIPGPFLTTCLCCGLSSGLYFVPTCLRLLCGRLCVKNKVVRNREMDMCVFVLGVPDALFFVGALNVFNGVWGFFVGSPEE